jgi:REP element-mobilizing transposase RayT
MSVRKTITEYDGIYFITLTCCRWLNLFEIANAYDAVYKWFDHLKTKGHFVLGYVTMPNHLHALLAFRNTQGQSINSIIGNGKRFMAYDIISKLKAKNEDALLQQLAGFVDENESRKGKLHEVFEPSFDWKECNTDKFIEQKLEYIHNNPCQGKWDLVARPWEYKHSSASYYTQHEQAAYPVMSYSELEDIDLTRHQG